MTNTILAILFIGGAIAYGIQMHRSMQNTSRISPVYKDQDDAIRDWIANKVRTKRDSAPYLRLVRGGRR